MGGVEEEGPASVRQAASLRMALRPAVRLGLPGRKGWERGREQHWAEGEAGLRCRVSEGLSQAPGAVRL